MTESDLSLPESPQIPNEREDHDSSSDLPTKIDAVCDLFESISRGVVSGRDAATLLSALGDVLGSRVSLSHRRVLAARVPSAERVRISGQVLEIPIASGLAIVLELHHSRLTHEALRVAQLLALPLWTCFCAPISIGALRAPSTEGTEEALKRISSFVVVDVEGAVVWWTETARQQFHARIEARGGRLDSVLRVAAQNFIRGERNLQRLVSGLRVSFAYLGSKFPDRVVAAIHVDSVASDLDTESPALPLLSRAELEVARLLLSGRSETHIGRSLRVSAETVKSHRKHIYEKLGVASRNGLVSLLRGAGGTFSPLNR